MNPDDSDYLLNILDQVNDALDRLQDTRGDLIIARTELTNLIRRAYRVGYTDGFLRARAKFSP